MTSSSDNRELGIRINKEIWNGKQFEKIVDYFTEDFVADYSPRIVREGRSQIEEMVTRAHLTFEGFKEEIKHVVADESFVVVHFTISGKQIGDWGGIPATNKLVKYDEIVIMQVRDGKVCRQIGISDSLLAFQQLGLFPDPGGLAERSLR